MGIVREYTFRGDDRLVWRAVRQWALAHGFAIESLQPSTLDETLSSLSLGLVRPTGAGHFAHITVTLDRADSDTCQIRLSLKDDGGGDRWAVVELAAALHDLGAKLDAPELRETPAAGAPEARETPAVPATPDTAGVGEKPKGQRRRGRLPVAEAEKRAVCERWLKAQVTTRQDDFCDGEWISTSTLREWLNDLGIE